MIKRLIISVATTLEFALSAIPQGQGYTISAFGEDHLSTSIPKGIRGRGRPAIPDEKQFFAFDEWFRPHSPLSIMKARKRGVSEKRWGAVSAAAGRFERTCRGGGIQCAPLR
jgi:hypothetical protein